MRGMKIAAIAVLAVLAAGLLAFMGVMIVAGNRFSGFLAGGTPVLMAEEELGTEGISKIAISSYSDDIYFLASPSEKILVKQYHAGRDSDFEPYEITKNGEELIIEKDWKRKGFPFFYHGEDWGYVEICLPAGYPEEKLARLKASSSSGDIEAEDGLTVLGSLSLSANSGWIKTADLVCRKDIEISTSSGWIKTAKVSGGGDVSFSSSSGDMDSESVSGQKLSFKTSSGSIGIGTASGNDTISFTASSGDVKTGTVTGGGEISFSTVSGEIKADSVSGGKDITFSASSGDISVKKITAQELTAKTGSGGIGIMQSEIIQKASVTTSSGDSDTVFSVLPLSLRVESTSGSSRLSVLESESFRFKASTSSGDIVTFFDDLLGYSKDGKRAEGEVGTDGAKEIGMTSSSGDIKVKVLQQ